MDEEDGNGQPPSLLHNAFIGLVSRLIVCPRAIVCPQWARRIGSAPSLRATALPPTRTFRVRDCGVSFEVRRFESSRQEVSGGRGEETARPCERRKAGGCGAVVCLRPRRIPRSGWEGNEIPDPVSFFVVSSLLFAASKCPSSFTLLPLRL